MRFLVVVLSLLISTAVMADGRAFFEPTQADYDCCNSEIMAQQERYYEAKNKGDYDEAVVNALFYWTRAWLHFNEAVKVGVVGGQWSLDADELNKALGLLDKAGADAKAAAGAGTSKDCLAKVRANRATIKGHLKYLENK